MKTWGSGDAVDHNDLNGNFAAVTAAFLALGAKGGKPVKAWIKGEPVSHDDLNTNFNSLMALAAQLASGGAVVVSGGGTGGTGGGTGGAGGTSTPSNHVLRRNGNAVLLRDGTYLTFR